MKPNSGVLGLMATVIMILMAGTSTLVPSVTGAVPVCIDDFCFDVPTDLEYVYGVRAADFDGNGLTDLYVRGNSKTYVKPFLVLQTGSNDFTLAQPTEAQRALASTLQNTSIAVYRDDFNFDAFLDFELENIDEVIPGAPDLIILTTRNDGETAESIVKEDARFDQTTDDIEFTLSNLDDVLNFFDGISCIQEIIPVPVPFEDEETGQVIIEYLPQLVTTCFPNSILPVFDGDFGIFCGGMSTYQSAIGLTASSAEATQVAKAQAESGRIIRTAQTVGRTVAGSSRAAAKPLAQRLVRSAAIRGAILILRGAAFVLEGAVVVLATPEVLIVGGAILLIAGGFYIFDRFVVDAKAQKIPRNKLRDAIVREAQELRPNYDPTADKYLMKPTCKPFEKVAAQTKAPNNVGSSKRLGDNLALAGCECPPGSAAHHMYKKKGGGPDGDAMRKCFEDAGINVDLAGNGICLPLNNEEDAIKSGKSGIASHQESGLHTNAQVTQMLRDCKAATEGLSGKNPGDPRFEAARRLLDAERARLSTFQFR